MWSGIQAFSALHYQLRVKAGDRLLLCAGKVVSHSSTPRHCKQSAESKMRATHCSPSRCALCAYVQGTDLVLSSLAGVFGAKLIVATHTPQAHALFTGESVPSAASAAASPAAASTAARLNPLAHVLRVVDCSSLTPAQANESVLAAVMEETGGLGVDGIIDLQQQPDEFNFLAPHLRHLTMPAKQQQAQQEKSQEQAGEQQQPASESIASSSASASSTGVSVAPLLSPSSAPSCLVPSAPIRLSTLIQCLAVQGQLTSSTPNLQLDPPLSRQLFLRGAGISFLFPQQWILGATQRGKLARQHQRHIHSRAAPFQ